MQHHTLVWKEQELIQRKEYDQSLPKKSEFRSAEENISKVGDAGFVWSIRGQGCPRQFREKLGIPEFG